MPPACLRDPTSPRLVPRPLPLRQAPLENGPRPALPQGVTSRGPVELSRLTPALPRSTLQVDPRPRSTRSAPGTQSCHQARHPVSRSRGAIGHLLLTARVVSFVAAAALPL